jgi:hypothetical protein
MKDSDLLSRAARALREEHDGHRPGSGYTRARIMRQLHQKRRRRVLVWVGFSPLFALVAGSAWAQSTDSWQRVWDGVHYGINALSHVVSGEGDLAERELEAPITRTSAPAASSAAHGLPGDIAPAAPAAQTAQTAQTAQVTTELGAADAGVTVTRTSKPRRHRAPASAAAPLPDRDPELAEFRAAHDAHFRSGSASGAVVAYQRYLERFPRGRFVPEARYNLGLLELKLGHVEKAKSALLPFAQGAFGGYRQTQAQALLRALERPTPNGVGGSSSSGSGSGLGQ